MTANEARMLVKKRIADLLDEERRLRSTLIVYRRLSWICIAAGIVFPILASSALLGSQEIFGGERWGIIGGFLALAAAVLTSLHKGFECESYQADCKRALLSLRSLIEGYEATGAMTDKGLDEAIVQLEGRLGELRRTAFDIPPRRRRVLPSGAFGKLPGPAA